MKKILTFILLFISVSSFSQKQANIWYFGFHAGLDFNSGTPVVLTNSAMSQAEGGSSIADANGNLLFYTDGVTVWNSNHVTMANGTGLNGNASTTQSALIIQQPGSASIYYLFTLDAQLGPNGFNYSIIDMSLNGGLGGVTIKNNLIYTPSSEKITAVNQSNGFDVWIITHDDNTNNFQSYPLTASGFNTTPVVSSVGPPMSGINDVIGYLKVSIDGHRLAMALSTSNEFWLFDFDPSTGLVTNPILLTSAIGASSGSYGVEFSPNGNILYGTVEGAPTVSLFQWDLSSGNAATINSSRIDLNPTLIGANYMGSLSIAPDGKIYFTRNTCGYLSCINNPDILGPGCNMIDSAIYLQGKQCVYGLPNLNQSLYNSSFTFSGTCFGDSTYFDIPNTTGIDSAVWDFDDPASGLNNIANATNLYHSFTASGTYQVTVFKYYAAYTDTVSIPVVIHTLPVVNLGTDTSFCAGNSFIIHAGTGISTYLWQDNSTDSIFTATQPGAFWVTVSKDGCEASDTVVLSLVTCIPGVNFLSSDTTFCGVKCIDFTDLSLNNPTSWQWYFPGADSTSSNLQNPVNICYNSSGSFDVTLIACNVAGCDTLFIPLFLTEYQMPAQPVISQSNDTLYSTPAYTYAWYNSNNPGVIISTNPYYTTSNGGSYFVIISDTSGCQNSSVVFVATGIHETIHPAELFTISPNPVSDMLTVILSKSLNASNIELTVFDFIGREIYNTSLHHHETSIKFSSAANGIYFIQLKTRDAIVNKKFIVHH